MEAWGKANGLPDPKDLPAVAKQIALLPKTNQSSPRVVVITQGSESTILLTSEAPDECRAFSVERLADEMIVDTNGAGDAFAGGFVGALIVGKEWEECVRVGHDLGRMCVQQAS